MNNNLSSYYIKKIEGKDSMGRVRKGNLCIIFSRLQSGNIIIARGPRGDIYK